MFKFLKKIADFIYSFYLITISLIMTLITILIIRMAKFINKALLIVFLIFLKKFTKQGLILEIV